MIYSCVVYVQSSRTLKEIFELQLPPSSPQLCWKVVCEMAGITTSQKLWDPPHPTFGPLENIDLTVSNKFIEVWKLLTVTTSEIGLYSIVEVVLFDAICSYEAAEAGVKGKYKVVEQFPVLRTENRGAHFTVDFCCGIVTVCCVYMSVG